MLFFTPKSAEERAREAFREFHNYSLLKYPKAYALTLDELIKQASVKNRFLSEAIGDAIIFNDMSSSKVQKAMYSLADRQKGTVPPNWMSWIGALTNQSTQVSVLESVPYVATESAKDVVKGFAQVGDTAITTLKSFGAIAPLAILAAGLFIFYSKTRQIAGR